MSGKVTLQLGAKSKKSMHQQFYVEDDEAKKADHGNLRKSSLKDGKEVVRYVDGHVSTEVANTSKLNSLTRGDEFGFESISSPHNMWAMSDFTTDKDRSGELLLLKDSTPNLEILKIDEFQLDSTVAIE